MPTIFLLLFLLSLISLITGLIKPSSFNKIFKRTLNRKNILTIFGIAPIIFFISIGLTAPHIEKEEIDNSNIVKEQEKPIENTNEILNLDDQENIENVEDDFVEEIYQEENVNNNQSVPNNENQSTQNSEENNNQTENNQPIFYSVTKVTDGDTFKVDINGTIETVRLIGVDTPETVDPRKSVECFGIEASNRAKELLTNKKVRLESDPTSGDRGIYGRLLRYVWLEDGTFFNKKMILDGYASEYTYNTQYKYQTEFKQAETDARNNKRGLWADGVCVEDNQITNPPTTQSTDKYYTSSHYSAKYYYPEDCDGWKSLSEKYLKSYDSLESLLQDYPGKTLSPQCQ